MNTCEKCKFWEKVIDTSGVCRRFPATPIVFNGDIISHFPISAAHFWCGEFQHACPHVKNV